MLPACLIEIQILGPIVTMLTLHIRTRAYTLQLFKIQAHSIKNYESPTVGLGTPQGMEIGGI